MSALDSNTGHTTVVIFGASGDLTRRKLIPALYNNFRKKRLPAGLRIVGFARREWSDDQFRDRLGAGVKEYGTGFDDMVWSDFAGRIGYVKGNLDAPEDYGKLQAYLHDGTKESADHLYYLATAPDFYGPVCEHLASAGMTAEDRGQRRIIIEKPFGRDLVSARDLNRRVHAAFAEHQIFRIDHYLGKETAQNILFLRFANTFFEPVWNRRYVANVQISVAESVDVKGRGGNYDKAGVLRDMFQNHLMQLLALVTMEPPASLDADAIRNEKVKVLGTVRPISLDDTVRAQYEGYRSSDGMAPDSQTHKTKGPSRPPRKQQKQVPERKKDPFFVGTKFRPPHFPPYFDNKKPAIGFPMSGLISSNRLYKTIQARPRQKRRTTIC